MAIGLIAHEVSSCKIAMDNLGGDLLQAIFMFKNSCAIMQKSKLSLISMNKLYDDIIIS